jgi:hypothetical protein
MKKVNVLTFCTWTSIGSILQSLGLKKALESSECESCLLLADENKFSVIKVTSLKSFISRIFQIMINGKRRRAYRKRCDFIDNNLNVVTYESYEDLTDMVQEEQNSYYLAGSDQIWNPDRCYKHFFLEFVKNRKCVSYAASMGKTEIPIENIDKFSELMQRLDHISVRENQCKDVLQPLTEKKISVHIDPTFLVDAEEWRKYEKKYSIRKPYILLYMIYWDSEIKEQIKELKKRTGLPVYAICSGLSRVYADKRLYDVGVEEFLWLIDNAKYVITSSFHGVAFATIFNKKFAALVNPSSPSRIQNLMGILNIPNTSIGKLDQTDDFDYNLINKKILEERSKSMEYLKEVFE